MGEQSSTRACAVVQRAVDAANVRDIDAAMSCWAPDGVYDMSPVGLGAREGHAAIRAHFEEWWGGYDDYEHRLEEVRELEDGVVFCVAVQRGRLHDSAAWVELRYGVIVTCRDGLIERITNFANIEEAGAAAERIAGTRLRE